MPLEVIDPKIMITLVLTAVIVIGLVVLILLGLLYGLKKIFGKQFVVNYKIEFKSTALFIACLFLAVISFMVFMIDEDKTNKMAAGSVLVGSLAAIGVNVKFIKLPQPGGKTPENTTGETDSGV